LKYDEVALITLGLNPADDPDKETLEDALDEEIYKESNYFLKREFLPKLADKRIARLKPICNLSVQLGAESDADKRIRIHSDLSETEEISSLIAQYNEIISKIKLEITRSNSACDIIQLYIQWKNVFLNFAKFYCKAYDAKVPVNGEKGKKRLSRIDFVELGAELNDGNYSGLGMDLYALLKSYT